MLKTSAKRWHVILKPKQHFKVRQITKVQMKSVFTYDTHNIFKETCLYLEGAEA